MEIDIVFLFSIIFLLLIIIYKINKYQSTPYYSFLQYYKKDDGEKCIIIFKSNKLPKEAYEFLGHIYFYGTKTSDKNYDLAKKYYNKSLLYKAPKTNIILIKDNLNTILEEEIVIELDKALNEEDNELEEFIENPNHIPIFVDEYRNIRNNNPIMDNIHNYEVNDNMLNQILNNGDLPRIEINGLNRHNDSQNVHDTQVNKNIKQSLTNLEKTTPIIKSYSSVIKILKNKLDNSNEFDNQGKANVKRVLNRINEMKDMTVGSNTQTTGQVLELVVNRIETKNNEDKEKGYYNLFNEMTECINPYSENGMLCNTGIYNRIVDSLNGLDGDITIMTKEMLKDQLRTKTAEIRDNLINEIGDEHPDYDTRLKQEIRTGLQQEFVNTNKMTQEELDKDINSWIDYI